MDKPITKDGIEVAAGQVWRDLDKRMRGRTVVVEFVCVGNEACKVKGARSTQLAIKRMHKPLWELVK